MILVLPFPPSVNSYWRAPNKGPLAGRHLISADGRRYRNDVFASVLEQLRRIPKALRHDVSIDLVLYPPNRARRDLDNCFKALFDALTHAGIWVDDSQVKQLSARWGEVTTGGKAEITIREITA
ncbi:RusA family crossover junction endodeoxyribonuclease [Sodalis sp. RH20]|uniref:RusA family crossover junction endodeoxyribonuclease n=1 Tax=unclassified Sodalis (in: enterobacteria) TaxID=2636512 RepID=UPI0039B4A587